MSKYFTGVEFAEAAVAPVEVDVSRSFPLDFEKYLTEFNRMIQAIQDGQSTITPGAIDLRNASVCVALRRLAGTPSPECLREFLNLTEQDINLRARREFLLILKQRPEVRKWLETFLPDADK